LHGNSAFHLKWRSENHFYLRLRRAFVVTAENA